MKMPRSPSPARLPAPCCFACPSRLAQVAALVLERAFQPPAGAEAHEAAGRRGDPHSGPVAPRSGVGAGGEVVLKRRERAQRALRVERFIGGTVRAGRRYREPVMRLHSPDEQTVAQAQARFGARRGGGGCCEGRFERRHERLPRFEEVVETLPDGPHAVGRRAVERLGREAGRERVGLALAGAKHLLPAVRM